jgi:hypothetical protein
VTPEVEMTSDVEMTSEEGETSESGVTPEVEMTSEAAMTPEVGMSLESAMTLEAGVTPEARGVGVKLTCQVVIFSISRVLLVLKILVFKNLDLQQTSSQYLMSLMIQIRKDVNHSFK